MIRFNDETNKIVIICSCCGRVEEARTLAELLYEGKWGVKNLAPSDEETHYCPRCVMDYQDEFGE